MAESGSVRTWTAAPPVRQRRPAHMPAAAGIVGSILFVVAFIVQGLFWLDAHTPIADPVSVFRRRLSRLWFGMQRLRRLAWRAGCVCHGPFRSPECR